jgi:threonine/homoserine/homoserine lactone efflux protein
MLRVVKRFDREISEALFLVLFVAGAVFVVWCALQVAKNAAPPTFDDRQETN